VLLPTTCRVLGGNSSENRNNLKKIFDKFTRPRSAVSSQILIREATASEVSLPKPVSESPCRGVASVAHTCSHRKNER
jgi:hypothetical protein